MSVAVLNTNANVSGKTLLLAENADTITGLKTFDRDPSAPFAVTSGSAVVTNLDADKLDGQDGTYYRTAANDINEFTSIAFVAGNFTATGGGTWTLTSPDQVTFGYFKSGKKVTLIVVLDATSVAGTVSKLNIAAPFTAAKKAAVPALVFNNSGSIASLCIADIAASSATIAIELAASGNFTASANLTYVRFELTYEATT